jgi:hypothetical protein
VAKLPGGSRSRPMTVNRAIPWKIAIIWYTQNAKGTHIVDEINQ